MDKITITQIIVWSLAFTFVLSPLLIVRATDSVIIETDSIDENRLQPRIGEGAAVGPITEPEPTAADLEAAAPEQVPENISVYLLKQWWFWLMIVVATSVTGFVSYERLHLVNNK